MSVVAEFREFFLRNTQVSSGSKPDQEANYPVLYSVTNLLGSSLSVFNRFLKNDYPNEGVFTKLFQSIAFKLNPEDTAAISQQGLVKIVSDADAFAQTISFGDSMIRTIQPYQTPAVVTINGSGLIVTKGYIPTGGTWQAGQPVSGTYTTGYKITKVADESWKIIGNNGNMANGQPIPTYASNVGQPTGGQIPLQIKMTADGKLAIRGWIKFAVNPTTPQLLFNLPTGYIISGSIAVATLNCNNNGGASNIYISLVSDGTVNFLFSGTYNDSNDLNIPEQVISLV